MSFKEKVAKFMKASALKHELSFDRSPRPRLGEGKAPEGKDIENSVSCRKLVNIWESRAQSSDPTPSTPPRVERHERPPPGSTTEEGFSSPKGGPSSSAGDYPGSEADSLPSHQDDLALSTEDAPWAKPVTVYVEEVLPPTNSDQGARPAPEEISAAPSDASSPLSLVQEPVFSPTTVAGACVESHLVSPQETPSAGDNPSTPEPCRRVCPTCGTVLRAATDGSSDDESSMSAATWVEPPVAQAAASTTEQSSKPAVRDIAVQSARKEQLVLRVVKAAAACVVLLALGGGLVAFSGKGSVKSARKEEEPSRGVVLGGLFGSSTPPPYLLRDNYYSAAPPTSKMFPLHPPPSFSVSRG